MNRIVVLIIVVVGWMVNVSGQELVSTFIMDTTIYEYPKFPIHAYPGPYVHPDYNGKGPYIDEGMLMFFLKKKGSSQIDIFSFSGKVGEIVIPELFANTYNAIIPSQTFIDDDDRWEYIITYPEGPANVSSVCDDNGKVLVSDYGTLMYGFDGKSTYVAEKTLDKTSSAVMYKFWRFRSDVTASHQPVLAKTSASTGMPFMTYGPGNGTLQVHLEAAGGGKTSLQILDLLGRCIFARQFDNLSAPVTFTVPETGVPNTPFLAKVKNDNGTYFKREIPVR